MRASLSSLRAPLGLVLSAVVLSACPGPGTTEGDAAPKAPTVEAPPARVKEPTIELRGTKDPGSQVILEFSDGETREASHIDDTNAWTYALDLREGANTFSAVAVNAGGKRSDAVGPFTVELDTMAPPPPTVDTFPSTAEVPAGSTSVEVQLSGTLPDGATLLLDGTPLSVTGTTWQHTVSVALGPNQFAFQSADDVDNRSVQVLVDIEGLAALGPPTLSGQTPALTNQPVILSGTRPEGAGVRLKWRDNAAASVDVVMEGAGTDFTTAALPLLQGANALALVSFRGDRESTALNLDISYDTEAPDAPGVDSYPTEFNLPQGETAAVYDLMGTKEMGAELFINGTLRPNATMATTWSAPITLPAGPNTFIITQRDRAGNVSEETEVVITVRLFVAPPVVSPAPPAAVANASLMIGGTKTANTGVLIRWSNGTEEQPTTLMPGTATTWMHTLTLPSEGPHTFSVFGYDVRGDRSAEVGPFTVALDTTAPAVPTVDPVTSPVGVPFGGASTPHTITGTKEAGAGILINNTMQTVDLGATTWTAQVTVAIGNNTYQVVAVDSVGNRSTAQSLMITGREFLPSPQLDPLPSHVRSTPRTLTGTKGAATGVLLLQGGTETSIVPVDATTTWSHDLALVEGNNTFSVVAVDANGWRSAVVGPIDIVLDTMGPSAPTVDAATAPATTDQVTITVTGTKDPDANVCLRQNAEPLCIPRVAINGQGTFSVMVSLTSGANELCFGSADEAGNTSATETCVTVTRLVTPEVTISSPGPGGVVKSMPFDVTATVVDQVSNLQSVRFCVGMTCVDGTAGANDSWTGSISIPGAMNGQGYEVVVTATNTQGLSGQARRRVLYLNQPVVVSSNNTAQPSRRVRVALDAQGGMHVAWHDNCWATSCDVGMPTNPYDIFYRHFDGLAWGPIIPITDASLQGEGSSQQPDITVDAVGNVHIVWQDDGDFGGNGVQRKIIHRMFDSVTGMLGPATVVTAGSTVADTNARLAAAPNGKVHVVFERHITASNHDVYMATWDNGVWASPQLISDSVNDGDSEFPDVAVDALNNVYVVWRDSGNIANSGTDFDVFIRPILDGGFGPIILVSDDTNDGVSNQPQVAVDAMGVAHIVWLDSGNILGSGTDTDVFHRSLDLVQPPGSQLSAYSLISDDGTMFFSDTPDLAVEPDTGDVYVAWSNAGDILSSGTDTDIFYRVRTVGGWGEQQLVSSGPADTSGSMFPSLAIQPGSTLHVCWEDQSDRGFGTHWDVVLDAFPLASAAPPNG